MWWPLGRGAEVLVQGVVLSDRRPPDDTRRRVRGELSIPDDAVVAITVANMRREKDYPNLLWAASWLCSACRPSWSWLSVRVRWRDDVASLHRDLALGDSVRLLGYRNDVPYLLAASDVFILASAHEGLPVSIMEAMVSALPVVATAVGGVPEAVEDGVTGLLVPAHDPEALAHALVSVAGDRPLRAAMGAAARERTQQFDIRTTVDAQEAAYAELAKPALST